MMGIQEFVPICGTEQWLDFIHNCILNTLSWKYDPVLDAAYLINSKININPNHL
ncbi:hypothetical protein [Litoribacter populi]|uniref:hypothetical protein n=1 Tax=Litoribacter populi TaxID=2598460 RepID=UPI00163DCE7E|nr:hypothetical protein [Litoribacter populi]